VFTGDSIKHECGLFGVWGHTDAAHLTYYGLHSLQHRGQDGAGIVVKSDNVLTRMKGQGLLSEVFTGKMLSETPATAAVGHVLYAVGGMDAHTAVQPLLFHFGKRSLAVCLNGALTNSKELRKRLDDYGSIFQTTCSAEILAHIIKRTRHISFVDSVKRTLNQIQGGFAALFMTQTKMIAARDPHGLRQLVIGKLGDFRRFITGIATHDGIYGQGAERMFNPEKTKENFFLIFLLRNTF